MGRGQIYRAPRPGRVYDAPSTGQIYRAPVPGMYSLLMMGKG
jgi:hypothetical protein